MVNGKDGITAISEAIANLDNERTRHLIEEALRDGSNPLQVLEALRKGLEIVGQRYDRSEYFLSELVISGQIMKDAMEALEPFIKDVSSTTKGRVVLGSALGDIHDIGKNIVKTMLIANGYEVHDLGVDVPPESFAKKAKEVGARVLGISALLSTTVPISAEVVRHLEREGARSTVKVILGGAAVRENMINNYHVDAAVSGVIEGMRIIKSWTA